MCRLFDREFKMQYFHILVVDVLIKSVQII